MKHPVPDPHPPIALLSHALEAIVREAANGFAPDAELSARLTAGMAQGLVRTVQRELARGTRPEALPAALAIACAWTAVNVVSAAIDRRGAEIFKAELIAAVQRFTAAAAAQRRT